MIIIPEANNNKLLYDELARAGKAVIKIRGYRYVYQNKSTLVPRFGRIAKKDDIEFLKGDAKVNADTQYINDHGAYRIAILILNGKYNGNEVITDLIADEVINAAKTSKVLELEAQVKSLTELVNNLLTDKNKEKTA